MTRQTYEPGCPNGGCNITRVYQMSASDSLAEHQIDVITYDRAGNVDVGQAGRTKDYYQRFGYNDQFGLQKLDLAYRGGSNVIRTGINWCDVARNPNDPSTPQPRSNWDWGSAEGFFRDVRTFNRSVPGTADDLRVVAFLYNSPQWAREGNTSSCDGEVWPPDPDRVLAPDSDWRYFVNEFTKRYAPNPNLAPDDDRNFTDAQLEAIEIWNEPNLAKFWASGNPFFTQDAPQRFADLVNAGSDEVKRVAPSLTVLPGGMSPIKKAFKSHTRFIEEATQLVARPIVASRIGGVSIHLYADGAMSDRKAVDNLKSRYQKLVAKLGPLSSRPRWITELGFPSAVVQGQRPKTQEKRLELAYLKFGDTPNVRAFIVHRLEDEGDANKQFGVLEENVEESVTCKPIYIRLATLRDSEDRVACP